MRDYEIVYIFRSSLTSEEIETKLERYHAIITADGSGEVTASVHWGKRQLAYPIRKQPNGYYVVAQFTSAPDTLSELERVLKLEDDVLRYLIVIAEQPLPLSDPAPTAPGTDVADTNKAGTEDAEAEEASETEEAGAEEASETGESEAEADAPVDGADADTGRDGADADADAGESDESADAKEG